MPKAPSVSLTKMIEATKVHPRTGLSLGVPPVTVPYGALVEPVGSERNREKFLYLGEMYECTVDLFLSATGGAQSASQAEDGEERAHEPATPSAPEPAAPSGPRLEWHPVHSNHHSVTRAAVPGGWLVAIHGSGVAFVPDAKHRWDGGSVE
jgi:hypothetical protein